MGKNVGLRECRCIVMGRHKNEMVLRIAMQARRNGGCVRAECGQRHIDGHDKSLRGTFSIFISKRAPLSCNVLISFDLTDLAAGVHSHLDVVGQVRRRVRRCHNQVVIRVRRAVRCRLGHFQRCVERASKVVGRRRHCRPDDTDGIQAGQVVQRCRGGKGDCSSLQVLPCATYLCWRQAVPSHRRRPGGRSQ